MQSELEAPDITGTATVVDDEAGVCDLTWHELTLLEDYFDQGRSFLFETEECTADFDSFLDFQVDIRLRGKGRIANVQRTFTGKPRAQEARLHAVPQVESLILLSEELERRRKPVWQLHTERERIVADG